MRKSVEKEVLYPDDLPEFGGTSDDHLKILDPGPVEAEDVPAEGASHGQWVLVENGKHGEVHAAAPRGLREFLADAYDEHGVDIAFQVFDAQREDEDHAPWRFHARVVAVDGEKVEPGDGYEVDQI